MKSMKIGDIIKIKPAMAPLVFGSEDNRPTGLIVGKWQKTEMLRHERHDEWIEHDIIEVLWNDNLFEEIVLSDMMLEILEVVNENR